MIKDEQWPKRAFVLLVIDLTVFLVVISVSGNKSVTLIKKPQNPKPILLTPNACIKECYSALRVILCRAMSWTLMTHVCPFQLRTFYNSIIYNSIVL